LKEPSEGEIGGFWDRHPVNADFVPGDTGDAAFFRAYDRRREETEPHVREELLALDLADKRVLEIGLGHGTESQLLAERAGRYVGVDLTAESVRRVRRRFRLFGLRGDLGMMSGERLGFRDAAFDLVFCHGVIHHSPRAAVIVSEIHRVLKPGGLAVAMLYHRSSLNYQVSIRVLRRLGIFALAVPGVVPVVSAVTGEPRERLSAHTRNLRQEGLGYLRMDRFIHHSTDGPHNVYSSVWTEREAAGLFSDFRALRFARHFLNDRHLPGLRILPARARRWLAARVGWHLWIFARR
jgi:SAM-dependent methyltransferase